MSSLPSSQVKADGAVFPLVVTLALGKDAAAGIAAFATRDVFAAFRDASNAATPRRVHLPQRRLDPGLRRANC
jgi:hypothetical protein